MSYTPPTRFPNLFDKSTLHSFLIIFLASGSKSRVNFIFLFNAFSKIAHGSLDIKGGLPIIISYKNIPKAYQSTEWLYPLLYIISGAIYSGVPQNVYVLSHGFNFLINPKSASFKYPFDAIKTFSGLRSL